MAGKEEMPGNHNFILMKIVGISKCVKCQVFTANAYLSFLAVRPPDNVIDEVVERLPPPLGPLCPSFGCLSALDVSVLEAPHLCALAGKPSTHLVG